MTVTNHETAAYQPDLFSGDYRAAGLWCTRSAYVGRWMGADPYIVTLRQGIIDAGNRAIVVYAWEDNDDTELQRAVMTVDVPTEGDTNQRWAAIMPAINATFEEAMAQMKVEWEAQRAVA